MCAQIQGNGEEEQKVLVFQIKEIKIKAREKNGVQKWHGTKDNERLNQQYSMWTVKRRNLTIYRYESVVMLNQRPTLIILSQFSNK